MYTKQYWHYLCDACNKEIKPDDLSQASLSLMKMNQEERFFLKRSRKGRILHYCSKKCLDAHFHSGKGTPNQNLRPYQ